MSDKHDKITEALLKAKPLILKQFFSALNYGEKDKSKHVLLEEVNNDTKQEELKKDEK